MPRNTKKKKSFHAITRTELHERRFKAQVAIEAIKNWQTVAQIASEYRGRPNQVSQWKKQDLQS